jgi:DNA-binding MarR family transcriptional regulator
LGDPAVIPTSIAGTCTRPAVSFQGRRVDAADVRRRHHHLSLLPGQFCAMATKSSELREELQQTRPFHSPAHEAVISVLRTAAMVQRHISQVVEAGGVTIQQYNVLRILRGAGSAGLPTLAIRDRMIEEAAGITRLLDKLETAGYVIRERSTPDRRQVLCQITPAGLKLLSSLDEPVDAVNVTALGVLGDAEQATLIQLLGTIRAGYHSRAEDADGQGSERAGQPPR